MKIVVTGGHFSPAYQVLRKLKDTNEVLVVGRKHAFEGDRNETYEYKVCESENIRFKVLNAGRLQRKFSLQTIPSVLKFPKGIYSAIKILKEFNPDVVVTFGGYVGLPIALAASFLRIPVVLHEQTQHAGLSAKLIAKVASVICISFESSRGYFKGKNVILTGNPLREEIFIKQSFSYPTSKPIIYITGGSTGSRIINQTLHDILPELLRSYTVIHQAGNYSESCDYKRFEKFRELLSSEAQKYYVVKEFFTPREVAGIFQNATLVIGRAGINTVLELMATGCMSLLIPLPFGQLNEQKQNALLFERTGLCEVIAQNELSPGLLLAKIGVMIKEQKKYKENVHKALQYVIPNADKKIIEQIYIYGRRSEDRTSKER